jgi:hypothetical protein
MTIQMGLRPSSPAAAVASTAHYVMYGKRVLSELALPLPILHDTVLPGVDWVIRRGDATVLPPLPPCPPLTEDRAPDGTVLDRFSRQGNVAWLWDREAGTFVLEPERGSITVFLAPGADQDDVGLLLLGPVSAFMLHQTGLPALHASAVVTPRGACAFMGPSRRGKSTLAASLLHAGGRLLTDDILPLQIGSEGVYGVPGAAMMKLWPSTAQQILDIPEELPSLTAHTDKRLFDLGQHRQEFANQAAHLRAIYVPRRYDPECERRADVTIETLSARDAVLALLSQTFRGHYLYPSELAGLLVRYTQVARQVKVALLNIPEGLEHRDVVSARILEDLASA